MTDCKHDWVDEYYGVRCKHCDTFYPHGSEPWAYPSDDEIARIEREEYEYSHGRCETCGGEWGDGWSTCTCDRDRPDLDDVYAEIEQIVDELLARRYPDGPPVNLDWGGLYADAYELQAERAAIGQPCAKCGKPLPADLLCDCQTESEPPG
jgi:hypothetical protein